MGKLKLRPFRRKRKLNRTAGGAVLNVIIIAIFGIFMVLPLVYAIMQAFKPLDEIFIFPPRFFVRNPTLDNFTDLFILMSESWVPFTRYVFNTFFITIVGTVGHVIIASMAAYVLEKHKFPGSRLFFNLVVTSLMFAAAVTAIPNYLIMSKIGFLDTYLALIVPAFGYSLGLFLMKQFMETIPNSLLESARMDGAGEFHTFWKIAMPMVKPAWLTLVIFSFQILWGELGSTFIYSEQLKTLPYALNQILLGGFARAGAGAAATLLIMIVPIILFMVAESNVINTMATAGIKE